jgi:hypothetical protein
MHRYIVPAWSRRAGWSLPCCLLVLAAGCSSNRSREHVEVSGRVLYNGQPLPGGRVMFVTVAGAFSSSGNIDEQGNYKVQAPVGEVMIAVDNRMLRPSFAPTEARMKGAGGPHQPEPDPVKGTYKEIPNMYYTPDTSGLTFTVTPETPTHDIELKDRPN